MLLLANRSAALLSSFFFFFLVPWTISCHKHHSKDLLTVRWRNHSGSKDLETNTTDRRTKRRWFRPGFADHSLQTKKNPGSHTPTFRSPTAHPTACMRSISGLWGRRVKMLLCYSPAVWFGAGVIISPRLSFPVCKVKITPLQGPKRHHFV